MTITVKSCKRIIFLRGKKEEETKKHDVYNKEAYHITKLCIYIVAGTSQIIVIPGNKKLRSNSTWYCPQMILVIPSSASLSCYTFFKVLHASGFWCALGYAKNDSGFVILLASMAWEAQLEYLEFDSRVLNVDCLVGTKPSLLWEHGEDVGWVKDFMSA